MLKNSKYVQFLPQPYQSDLMYHYRTMIQRNMLDIIFDQIKYISFASEHNAIYRLFVAVDYFVFNFVVLFVVVVP